MDPYAEALGDPSLYKENLDRLRTQMKEIQDESLAYEHEMEGRLKKMTIEQQQRKYLPKTITEELAEAKLNAKANPQVTEVLTEFDKTKNAVIEKLGGEFDYGDFESSLKDILSEKDAILQDFRNTKLDIPPPAPKRTEKYNFASKPLQSKIKAPAAKPQKEKAKLPAKKIDEPQSIVQEEIIKKPKIQPPVAAAGPNGPSRARPTNRKQINVSFPPLTILQIDENEFPTPGKNVHVEETKREKNANEPVDLLSLK